jgi:hypothetical protein
MKSAKSIGRIIGILLLVHLATGLTVPYILMHPLTTPPGFLASAAGMAFQVRLSVLVLFVGGAVTVGIAIAAWPVFRRYSYALALWLLALAVVNFSLQAVENGHWLSMLSLSQEYAQAGAADAGLFQAQSAVVRAAWKWEHYTHLLVVVIWMFVLYGLLYRSALVPRALAASGMVAAVLQITGITLPQLLDYHVPSPTLFGLPLGLTYLALALWLIAKGFEERQHTDDAESHETELSRA